jgi:hypothetical protein
VSPALPDRRAILRDVSLALLESALAARDVDLEELRAELRAARRLGFDWRALYAEAVSRRRRCFRPAPSEDDVAPGE